MTKFLDPPTVHAPVGPYSHTAVVPGGSELVFVAGQVGMHRDGSIPASFAEQADVTFANVRACLAAHGLRVDAVVKLSVFIVPGQDFQVLRAARERHFGTHRPTVHDGLRAAAREPEVLGRSRGDRREGGALI